MRRAIVVALLLSMALLPLAQGSGGVINSVQITGNGDVGEGPIDLNISLVGVGGSSSSSVFWNATLSDLDGNLIDSDSGNTLVDESVNSYVETTLGNAPIGISNLTITLSGDVGTPGQDQWIVYYTSIQRLRPLDISIGSPLYNSVDSNGTSTGNLSINDGDFAMIDVPVINNGDIAWNGSINLSLDSVELQSQTVDISGDSTIIISFMSGQLSEGTHYVNSSLNGPVDSNPTDNILNETLEVGPPPLPMLELTLVRLTEPQAGAIMEWNLEANNSGSSDFSGQLICFHEGEQVFSTNANISVDESINFTVSMTSKPGELVCTSSGSRTSSTANGTDLVSMQSAVFIGAGHSMPSLLGGPWHAGDEITLSLLIRNEGDALGTASLRIEVSGDYQNGSLITLEEGKAGEVSYEFSFSSSGEHIVNWSLISEDGAVDSNLSGSLIVPVLPSQVVKLDVESVDIVDDGVEISWAVDLSEGRERLVILNFGSIQDGLKGEKIFEERNLLPGRTFGKMNIGFQNGQEVFAGLSVSGWVIGFGSITEDESTMPSYDVVPQITVNPSTQPKLPSAGTEVNVFYTISNLADSSAPSGQIVITDVSGHILSSESSPELTSGTSDRSTTVTWPSGDNVKIIVTWHVDGKSVTDEIMVASENVETEEEEFSMPWGGILGGLALGMVLIFLIRMKNSPAKDKTEKKSQATKKKKQSAEEKVEVACPKCERKLRVPSTYSGSVRCPECETKFEVEAKSEPQQEVQNKVDDKPEQDYSAQWSSSDNDILQCPKCTRKLKVPYDRRPAKARCPACETIFEARKS